ncbi:Zinc carboxypeptidase A 1, partial [Operophtera brumata]
MNVKHIFIFLFAIAVTSAVKNYDGYKVYKVEIKTNDELNVLKQVQSRNIGEFWEDQFDVSHVVKIMVAPARQVQFLEVLKSADVEVTEVIRDLQGTTESLFSLNWNQYHSLDEIYTWMDELAAAYPDIVSIYSIGRSFEDREIKGVILNYKPFENRTLIGMIEGTLHAREWISAATVTWIIKEFLTSTDPQVRALAENFEWHIFPVVNPDGYVYTFNH